MRLESNSRHIGKQMQCTYMIPCLPTNDESTGSVFNGWRGRHNNLIPKFQNPPYFLRENLIFYPLFFLSPLVLSFSFVLIFLSLVSCFGFFLWSLFILSVLPCVFSEETMDRQASTYKHTMFSNIWRYASLHPIVLSFLCPPQVLS